MGTQVDIPDNAPGSARRCRRTLGTFRPQGHDEAEDSAWRRGPGSAPWENTPGALGLLLAPTSTAPAGWGSQRRASRALRALANRDSRPGRGYLLGTSKLRQMAGRSEASSLVFP